MSAKNVELIRTWVERVFAGDPADLGDLSILDEDVAYEDDILPDHVGETYHGHEGFRKAWARALEPWEDIEGRLEWVRDAGEQVVSCHWGRMKGKESGIEAEIVYAYVWKFRGPKVVHCKSYGNPAEALAAAGLGE